MTANDCVRSWSYRLQRKINTERKMCSFAELLLVRDQLSRTDVERRPVYFRRGNPFGILRLGMTLAEADF
jgi:hypothetical protein